MTTKMVFSKNFDDFDDEVEYTYSDKDIEDGGILALIENFQKQYFILSEVVYQN